MSEYPKIKTLYERNENFKVQPGVLKNRVYGLLKSWHWTEKVDGTNIRIIWKDGKLTFGGKTDNAQMPSGLVEHLYDIINPEGLAAAFPDVTDVVMYGEGYGAGIQKGGDYSPTKKFILFDILVDSRWWLSYENICDVAVKLNLDVVPDFGEMALEEATEMVRIGFQSRLGGGKMKAEGLVGKPLEALFDKKGARLVVKLKTKDF